MTPHDNFITGALPTQEEAERQDLMDAFECLCLREAFQRAVCAIGKEEAKAIIEQELQRHKRMH